MMLASLRLRETSATCHHGSAWDPIDAEGATYVGVDALLVDALRG